MAKELTARELSALGGKARAKSLTKARRKEIAVKAATTRWGVKAKKEG